ncbi:hypothetical protein QJS66_14320 [Kocuria rhizophila]|nr:hypothetical protein QJS66_14320 [Kocuria rhizophila]
MALSDGLKRQSTRCKAPSTPDHDRLGYIAATASSEQARHQREIFSWALVRARWHHRVRVGATPTASSTSWEPEARLRAERQKGSLEHSAAQQGSAMFHAASGAFCVLKL